jgi:hypothetical protein
MFPLWQQKIFGDFFFPCVNSKEITKINQKIGQAFEATESSVMFVRALDRGVTRVQQVLAALGCCLG